MIRIYLTNEIILWHAFYGVTGKGNCLTKMAINNNQKFENYQEQLKRLKKAIANEFFLESIFIEYAIIEDRVESFLRHSEAFNPEKQRTLDNKLKKLESIQREKGCILQKYVSLELIASIYEWKNKRNPLCHALLKQELATESLKSLADAGNEIVRELCNKSTAYRRYLSKHNLND